VLRSYVDCSINAHRHCKDQVVMECRQKRQHTTNKHGSVHDSRSTRSSVRVRKTRKQKATQTEDLNFSSTSSSSGTSESCTSSSEDEQQQQPIVDKAPHHYSWHLRKPSSLKRRKQISSDSNDDHYYTHPPSPQPASSLTTITTSLASTTTSTNPTPALQLIPRGPLICSDSFEKWNDRCFTWNRPLAPTTLLSSVSNSSATTTTTESTNISKKNDDIVDKVQQQTTMDKSRTLISRDVSDDDTCFTSISNENVRQTMRTAGIYNSSECLNPRKLSVTESLRSLPTNSEQTQHEIFERLRQAEEVCRMLIVHERSMCVSHV
jgi:hypothetical protein